MTVARARRRGRARRVRIARDRSRAFAAVIAALALGGLVAALAGDYPIRDVDIVGASRLDPAIVQSAAGLSGASVFWASASAAEARVASIPAVRSARVTIQLPGRAVVDVVERAPAIVVSSSAGTVFADDGGRLFAAGGGARGLATLEDETGPRASGGRLDPALVVATGTIAAREPAYFGHAIERIRLTASYGLVVDLVGGTELRLGGADQVDLKLETAREIVVARAGKRLDYVDVRNRENPVFFPTN